MEAEQAQVEGKPSAAPGLLPLPKHPSPHFGHGYCDLAEVRILENHWHAVE